MIYCQLSDIRNMVLDDVLMRITGGESENVIDTDVVNEAIASAGNMINAYCESRYELPFSPVPSLITYISVVIAIHSLFSRKLEKAPGLYEERYLDARNMLTGISAGSITLDAKFRRDSVLT